MGVSDLAEAGVLERQTATVMEMVAKAGLSIATAESCTGGLLAALLTDIKGFSGSFDRGFVTYSEQSKRQMLGIPGNLIRMHGVVSRDVALRMAQGALSRSNADLSIGITGFAGPAGVRDEAGLVHLAVVAGARPAIVRECHFGLAERDVVRRRTVRAALEMLEEMVVVFQVE
ncbi:CinA family protein [Novosphingobium sp. CECT 9465]|uniref:CinA family protein n=1 Tax=Novosphingobium sp. CECT 9465 TaxID=2829794 RepID=UPI001F84CD4E|nr:Nicotinamide-nucleotide amidohydrolase PncC [Novosphingobium sp. CECT 9465]